MSYVAAASLKTYRPLVSKGEAPAFGRAVNLLDHDDAVEADAETRHDIDLRQLRHHTKNTLQRILSLIAEAPGLSHTPAGEKIAQELEYRIGLSASISEALFGLTNVPGSMADRLRQLAGAVVEMMRDSDQVIRVGVSVRGYCPLGLREAVLRSAHELLGNAVKHGMKNRPIGRITVRLVTEGDCTTLTIVRQWLGLQRHASQGRGSRSGAQLRRGARRLTRA